MRLSLLCLWCLLLPWTAAAAPLPYAVALEPLAVYNSPQAAASLTPPPTDRCGQVRQLEFIAFAGTPFRVAAELVHNQQPVLEVSTPSYQPPAGVRLFIAASGVKRLATQPPLRSPPTPPAGLIIQRLRSAVGLPYVWGGNLRQGIRFGQTRHYAGLDCSGLLYEATDGVTPRNTADLVSYGQAVPVAGLHLDQLLRRLQPLDLIVWKGHVVVVLDRETAIESVLQCGQPGQGGVQLTALRERLREIMARRRGVDHWPAGIDDGPLFVVRRWLP